MQLAPHQRDNRIGLPLKRVHIYAVAELRALVVDEAVDQRDERLVLAARVLRRPPVDFLVNFLHWLGSRARWQNDAVVLKQLPRGVVLLSFHVSC